MLTVSKDDLSWLQKRGFLKDSDAVNAIWQELSNRCLFSVTLCEKCRKTSESCSDCRSFSPQNVQHNGILDIPPVKVRRMDNAKRADISIAYSLKNGVEVAKMIAEKLSAKNYSVSLAQDIGEPFVAADMEKRVANSTCLVVILTANCLRELEVVFAMTVAKNYFKHISQVILVHDAGSCLFPGYDEQPPSLMELFSEKAVTFLKCYADSGVDQIIEKFESEKSALENIQKNEQDIAHEIYQKLCPNSEDAIKGISIELFRTAIQNMDKSISENQVDDIISQVDKDSNGFIDANEFSYLIAQFPLLANIISKYYDNTLQQEDNHEEPTEDISTRVFLSHKRSTGQGIAGRLFEGMKDRYKMFLDSEAKFKIHNLKQIVENTEIFVFILSAGILQSRWCCEELKSAVANKKKIIIIRDLAYSLPEGIPSDWQDVKDVLRSPDELIWMAEYNNACIDALKKRIGPTDSGRENASKLLQNNLILQQLKENSSIALENQSEEVLAGILFLHPSEISKADFNNCKVSPQDFAVLTNVATLSLERSSFDESYFRNHQFLNLQQLNLTDCKITDERLQPIVAGCPNLQQLNLTDCPDVADDGLQHIAKSCRHLQDLNITNCQKITDAGLQVIAQGCPNLQHLNLSNCRKITDSGLQHIAKGCPNLQHLNLRNLPAITDSGLQLIAQGCSNLQSLNLYYYDWSNVMSTTPITDSGLQHIAKGCRNLRRLELNFCKSFTDDGLQFIAQGCSNLEHLDLAFNSGITDVGVQHITQRCFGLQYLDLTNCNITDAGTEHIAKGCHNLQHLNLSNCRKVTDSGLQHIGQGCPNLQHLNLHGLSVITNSGLQHIGNGCSKLQHLDLSYSNNITDSGLQHIAKSCFKLQHLSLKNLPAITDAGLQHVVNCCSNLQYLQFNDLSITDSGLQHIANCCSKLQHLDLSYSKKITDSGVQQIISGCPNLQHINLFECRQITDVALEPLTKGCPNLQTLSLYACEKVTDIGLQHIGQGCSNLKSLNLFACGQITDNGLQQIAKGCIKLQYLDISHCRCTTVNGPKYFSSLTKIMA